MTSWQRSAQDRSRVIIYSKHLRDGIKGGVECKVPPSVKDVVLGPLGGEGVFLGPLGGEGVFSGGKMEAKGSYIVGDNHFRAL